MSGRVAWKSDAPVHRRCNSDGWVTTPFSPPLSLFHRGGCLFRIEPSLFLPHTLAAFPLSFAAIRRQGYSQSGLCSSLAYTLSLSFPPAVSLWRRFLSRPSAVPAGAYARARAKVCQKPFCSDRKNGTHCLLTCESALMAKVCEIIVNRDYIRENNASRVLRSARRCLYAMA